MKLIKVLYFGHMIMSSFSLKNLFFEVGSEIQSKAPDKLNPVFRIFHSAVKIGEPSRQLLESEINMYCIYTYSEQMNGRHAQQ